MPPTPVRITPRPGSTSPAATTAASKPPKRVVVTDIDSLTADNQRGCGDDNPYN